MAFLSFPTFFGLLPPTSLYVLTKAICPETSQTHSSTPCSYPPPPQSVATPCDSADRPLHFLPVFPVGFLAVD